MVRFLFAAMVVTAILPPSVLAGEGAPAPTRPTESAGPQAADAPSTTGESKSGSVDPAAAQRRAVDELLGRLAKTDDPRAAKRVAGAVQTLWMRSGSDTVDLLTARATEAQRARKLDVAVKLMDQVVDLRPDYAEGWNRRATMHFAAKDYNAAMADIHQVLVREPRHFGAWLALGRILADGGFDKQALGAFRKTIEIYPAVEGLKKEVDDLALKVEGQPI